MLDLTGVVTWLDYRGQSHAWRAIKAADGTRTTWHNPPLTVPAVEIGITDDSPKCPGCSIGVGMLIADQEGDQIYRPNEPTATSSTP